MEFDLQNLPGSFYVTVQNEVQMYISWQYLLFKKFYLKLLYKFGLMFHCIFSVDT